MSDPAQTEPSGVVVVAYRSAGTIGACLDGILDDPAVREVVVVDNAQDADTERAALGIGDARVRYVAAPGNIGFAAACNLGARMLPDSAWVFLVNPDVRLVRPLSELVRAARADTAILSARLDSGPDSLNARRRVTRAREFVKAVLGSGRYSADYRRRLSAQAPGGPWNVEQVDGALLGMRRATWDELGGLDERFELYYEDVDVCTRAEELGRIHFVSAVWGDHVGGASSGRTSREAYLVSRVSRIRYLRKHYGDRISTRAAAVAIGGAEFVARTLTRRPEGLRVRSEALALQWRELQRACSVHVLSEASDA